MRPVSYLHYKDKKKINEKIIKFIRILKMLFLYLYSNQLTHTQYEKSYKFNSCYYWFINYQ